MSDQLIVVMGRWSSAAWLSYASMSNVADINRASADIWRAARRECSFGVAVPADLSAFEISGAEVMREVPRFAQDSRDVGDVLVTKWGRVMILEVISSFHYACCIPGKKERCDIRIMDAPIDELFTDVNHSQCF